MDNRFGKRRSIQDTSKDFLRSFETLRKVESQTELLKQNKKCLSRDNDFEVIRVLLEEGLTKYLTNDPDPLNWSVEEYPHGWQSSNSLAANPDADLSGPLVEAHIR